MLLQFGFGLIVQCAFLINFMAVFALYSLAKKKRKQRRLFFVSESIWVDFLAMLGGHKVTTRKRRGAIGRWSVKNPGLVR